jgi:UDP-glucose 4-epimerase
MTLNQKLPGYHIKVGQAHSLHGFEAMAAARVERLVVASYATVHVEPIAPPVAEKSTTSARQTWDWDSKRCNSSNLLAHMKVGADQTLQPAGTFVIWPAPPD